MLSQKECAAAYDLFTTQRAWALSEEDYLITCENNYASVEIIEIHSLSQWITEAKCNDVVQIMRESDTRRSFFLKEKWIVRPEDSEKAPPGFQREQVFSSWVSVEFENGRWKIGHFFSNPPCNDDDLNWKTVSNAPEVASDSLLQAPEDVIRAYSRYRTGKRCLAAYNLLYGEAASHNPPHPEDAFVSFCQSEPTTWEVTQITPYSEWCHADDNVWDNETQRKFYVKIRLAGYPMFIGKGITGFVIEQFYEYVWNVELIDGTWRITQTAPAFPRQCHVQP
jgi:hypothetical protein